MDGTLPNITTPYFKYIEILALNALGDRPSALKVLRSYWGGMLDVNASTFFESFSEEETSVDIARFYDRPFGRSLCKNHVDFLSLMRVFMRVDQCFLKHWIL
jgi:alpha-L-rhamnosidase